MTATTQQPPAKDKWMEGLSQLEQEYVRDRKYHSNVSVKTLEWYRQSFRAFEGCVEPKEYKQRIETMRDRGVKPVSINSWIRCLNSYFHWRDVSRLEEDNGIEPTKKCHPACKHFKLRKQLVDQKVIHTFTQQHQRAILGTRLDWLRTATPERMVSLTKGLARGHNAERAQALCALLLDTGMRLGEALTLRRGNVDLENLIVKVEGKGRKERLVPISLDGRRWIYKWLKTQPGTPETLLFPTRVGTPLQKRWAERDVTQLCKAAGVEGVRCSPHTFRHTFAVSYMRNGGNIEYLRRILGHTSITITQGYLRDLGWEDVQAPHNGLSPLAHLGQGWE